MRESWPHGKYDNRSLRRGEDGIASSLKHKIGGVAAAVALLSAVSMCVALAPMTSAKAYAADESSSSVSASEAGKTGQGTQGKQGSQAKSSAKKLDTASSSDAASPSSAASSAGHAATVGSSAGTGNTANVGDAGNTGNAGHSTQTAATTKNDGAANSSKRSLTRATCTEAGPTTFYNPVGPDGDAHPNHNDALKGTYWKVSAEGSDCVLHIGNNGMAGQWGKIATNDDGNHSEGHQIAHDDFWPWYGQSDEITKVVVDVNANGYKVYTLNASTLDYMFANMPNLVSADVKNLDVESPGYMRSMFANDPKLQTVDTTSWRPYWARKMQHMFDGDTKLTNIDGIGDWFRDAPAGSADQLSDTSYMFSEDASLTSMDLSKWASHLTVGADNMSYMFNMVNDAATNLGDTQLTSIDLTGWPMGFNTAGMFRGCTQITGVGGLRDWDMSQDQRMDTMFKYCSNLQNPDMSQWDTHTVWNLDGMFENDSALTDLSSIKHWNTANVTTMGAVFDTDTALTKIDVSGWNTEKVTNFSWTFRNCPKLPSITGIEKWHTPAVIKTYAMFDGDHELTALDLSGWHLKINSLPPSSNPSVDRYGDMSGMFADCPKLETLTGLDDWETSAVTEMYSMFIGDGVLKELDLSHWTTPAVDNMGDMFRGCTWLDKISVGTAHFSNGAFYDIGGEVHFLRNTDDDTDGNDVTANGITEPGVWHRAHATITILPSSALHYETADNGGPGLTDTMPNGTKIAYYTRDHHPATEHYEVGTWSGSRKYDYISTWNYGDQAVPSVLTPVLVVSQRTLNGTVWFDTQKDGAIGHNEPRMKKGTRVEVLDSNGHVVAHTTVDENGNWTIGNLPAGTGYRVRIEAGDSGIPQAGGFQNTVSGPDFDPASGSFDSHGNWTSAPFDMPATTQDQSSDGTWSKTENLGIHRGKTTGTPMTPLPVQHKVHVGFNSNGGTSVPGQDLSWVGDGHGEASKPADPTREGYKFAGWTLHGGDGKTLYDFSAPVTGDITLDALWTKVTSTPAGNQQKAPGAQAANGSKPGKLAKTGAAVSALAVVALASAAMGSFIAMKKRNQASRL
ncbi:BspA family leucine-rich repeat surface protein [Bifidobacterium sp. ESL0764]|uniref:BspA family leucine-rich repeat surface protein n=1 Tax=Bifidobacterium sp. ESL0764 TaxID=2983228 RepID=UPI0023F73F01|nr:BspA family leucine-rich repeat surface protein [Bifidobacterium sp. ESL0764]WEV65831.1 BspA family leucine-rich repeat surface protein [Bifidobacterium sp. ESL0764]